MSTMISIIFRKTFVYIIQGSIKTDYDFNKSENRKSEKIDKSEKVKRTEKWENRNISKSGLNHGANERPKGEPVAVGDLKASYKKVQKPPRNPNPNCQKSQNCQKSVKPTLT